MKKISVTLLPAVMFLLLALPAAAQHNMMLYPMADLPQRNQLNPALSYFGTGSVSIPLVSSPYLAFSNAFKYSDFIRRDSDDSLYMDPANMISKLKAGNYLYAAAGTNLFGFGLHLGASFVSFEVTERMALHMTYSKEMMDFLWKGNAASLGQETLLELGVNFTHRRDYALTYSHTFKNKVAAGIRAKYLYGMENISVEQARVSLLTDPNTFALTSKSNIQINTSGIASNTFDDFNADEYLFNRDNNGWGLDLGVQVLVTERMHISASVSDLGKITWRSHTENYISRNTENEFTFSGIDLNAFFADTSGASEVFDNILDTLENAFDINQQNQSYSTGLPVQTYLGIGYAANKRNAFHLLVHSIRFDDKTHINVSGSYVRRMGRWFSLSPGITYVNASVNPGLGAVLSLNSFQFYLTSDNFLGVVFPQHVRNFDARAGINFVIGRKN